MAQRTISTPPARKRLSGKHKEASSPPENPLQNSPNGKKVSVTFTSDNGEVYEIPDLPDNLGRATALAAENNLRKIWGTEQEAQECQDIFGEK